MSNDVLNDLFIEAVSLVNAHKDPFPADVLLKFYAYYKKATQNNEEPTGRKPIINAFKTNALMQAKDLNTNEAKELYINLAHKYFLYREE